MNKFLINNILGPSCGNKLKVIDGHIAGVNHITLNDAVFIIRRGVRESLQKIKEYQVSN
jgi:hypothetical protein